MVGGGVAPVPPAGGGALLPPPAPEGGATVPAGAGLGGVAGAPAHWQGPSVPDAEHICVLMLPSVQAQALATPGAHD